MNSNLSVHITKLLLTEAIWWIHITHRLSIQFPSMLGAAENAIRKTLKQINGYKVLTCFSVTLWMSFLWAQPIT